MREKTIENKLVQAVKNRGGLALKFISPSFDGMPDRLVLFPGGKIAFVEVKAMTRAGLAGRKPRPLQEARHRMLRRLGFCVFVLDHAEKIGEIIDEIRSA